MTRVLGVLLGLILLLPLPLHGQEEEGPPPELRLLDRYVGEWTGEHSSGMSFSQVCEWIGDYFVSCEWINAEGRIGMVQVFGYDAEAEVYTLNRFFGNTGWNDFAKGPVDGDTWTLLFDARDANPYRMVMTEEWPNDGSYTQTYVMESQQEGGAWEAYGDETGATFTKVR